MSISPQVVRDYMEYMKTNKSISPKVVRDYMEYIWRQINPYPQKWLGIIWNIWNKIFIIMTLATKFGALGKTLASVMEVEYPEMHLEEGALSASLISRHHLNVSCCRAGAGQGICNTKKRRADPSMGTAHYSTPPLLIFTFSPCCPNVVQ